MQIIRSIRRHPGLAGGCVLTVGNFDGLHLGHQAIIERVRARAAELSLPAVEVSEETMQASLYPFPTYAQILCDERKLWATRG